MKNNFLSFKPRENLFLKVRYGPLHKYEITVLASQNTKLLVILRGPMS